MHVGLHVEAFVEPEHGRAAAHDRHRSLNRLLHDVAELARVNQLAFAGHDRGFDRQQLAADLGPRETRDLTDLIVLFGAAVAELAHAQDTSYRFSVIDA